MNTLTDLHEFFDYACDKACVDYYRPDIVRELPDVPEDIKWFHPLKPDEIVATESMKVEPLSIIYEIFISEYFVRDCLEGKYGGKDASLDLLVKFLGGCWANRPIIIA